MPVKFSTLSSTPRYIYIYIYTHANSPITNTMGNCSPDPYSDIIYSRRLIYLVTGLLYYIIYTSPNVNSSGLYMEFDFRGI